MYKLIIVDDDETLLEGLTLAVDWNHYGFEVIGTATDGLQALEKIRAKRCDVLLTDIRMGRLNGLDLVQSLKNEGIRLRVIMMSAYEEFSYAQQAVRLGVEDYIVKPIDLQQLYSTITKLHDALEEEEKINARLTAVSFVADPKDGIRKIEEEYSMDSIKALIIKAQQYVDKNYASPDLRIKEVAEEVGLSANYFSTMFSRYSGDTFSNYLIDKRMKKAKQLMISTDMKIYEIAEKVGYENASYFSAAFKKYTGISVSQYRKRYG